MFSIWLDNSQDCQGRNLQVQIARAREKDKEEKPRKVYNDTNKVIVNRLSWDTTDDSLRAALEQYGPVEECSVCFFPIIHLRFSMIATPNNPAVALWLASQTRRTC